MPRQYIAFTAQLTWGPWVTVAQHISLVMYSITGQTVGDTVVRFNLGISKPTILKVVEECSV